MILKRKNKLKILFCIILIILGIGTLIYNFKDNITTRIKEKKAIEQYYQNNNDNKETTADNTDIKPDYDINLYQYVSVLKIPKINLEKGIVGKSSIFNSVNYGIEMLEESDYPDVTNGDFILAAHNGFSNVSHFRNLNKLSLGDEAYIDYKSATYKYKLVNMYDVLKTGKALIKTNNKKNNLVLITCKGNTDYQTVYIFELVK